MVFQHLRNDDHGGLRAFGNGLRDFYRAEIDGSRAAGANRNGAAIQRSRQFPADVRDALGVLVLLAVLNYLVRQHARRNQLVYGARAWKLGRAGTAADYFSFRDSICVAAVP